MKGTPLIGTGFYATAENYENQLRFLDIWLANTPKHNIVIIDNSVRPLVVDDPRVRIVRLNSNKGHVDQHKGEFRPQLLGVSICWIIGAMMAYNDDCDYVYKEQDTLCFGPWMEELYKRADFYKLVVQMGYALSTPARVECCLFWVDYDYIIEFICKYTEISEGDGKITPEEKFDHISRLERRIAPISFGVGRDRPLPFDAPIWFGQRFSKEEMNIMRERKLI